MRLRDPVAWLDGAIREEAANIRRLVSEGAEAYILLTCVAGTAARGRGMMDRLDERLKVHSEDFGIPVSRAGGRQTSMPGSMRLPKS